MERTQALKSILFVSSGLSYGGASKRLQLIQELLRNHGFNVGFFVLRSGLTSDDEKTIPKLFNLNSKNSLRGIFKTLLFLSNLIKKEKYKLIVCNSRSLYLVCKFLSIRHRLIDINLVQIVYNKTPILFKLLFAKNVIAVSEAVKSYLVNKQKIPLENITVIRNSSQPLQMVSEDQKNYIGNDLKTKGSFIISCIARFEPVKGQISLIHAIKILASKYKKIKLLLMGYGDYGQALGSEVNRLGLQETVTFIKPDYGVEKIMSISDLLVLPSLREGLPTVVLEGFSLGKTIVATDIPGTNEIVKDGYNGLLVPAKDTQALEAAIEKLITNDALRGTLEKNAKLTYERDFSFEKYKQQIVDYFEKLLDRSSV